MKQFKKSRVSDPSRFVKDWLILGRRFLEHCLWVGGISNLEEEKIKIVKGNYRDYHNLFINSYVFNKNVQTIAKYLFLYESKTV